MGDHRLTLACGRSLGYAEFGATKGVPVFYCHGFPGSRREAAFADRAAADQNVRIIAADRPGIGLSGYCPGRTILGWANDVRELADNLDLVEFSVLGVSGGAPYALACAYQLQQRIRSTAIVSGLAPPEALAETSPRSTSGLGLRLTAKLPWSAHVFARVLGTMARHASPLLLAMLSAKAPESDRRVLSDGEFRSILAASMGEAFRSGTNGAISDLKLLSTSWGLDLRQVRVPIHIWHGAKDRVVPMSMGRFLEQALPECHANYLEEHGHYSLVHDCTDQILSQIIDWAD